METLWACPQTIGGGPELNNEECDWYYYLERRTAGTQPLPLRRCFEAIVSIEEESDVACRDVRGTALPSEPIVQTRCSRGHILRGPKTDILRIPVHEAAAGQSPIAS